MSQSVDQLTAGPGCDFKPLSAQQRRIWLLEQLESAQGVHNISYGVEVRGPLEHGALQEALRRVVEREELLQSSFALQKDQPCAIRGSAALPSLSVLDLTAEGYADPWQTAMAQASESSRQTFSLKTGPLVRATLYRVDPSRHLLAVTLHRVIADPLTALLFIQAVADYYGGIFRTAATPEAASQYTEYVEVQQRYRHSEEFAGDLSYWKAKLDRVSAFELPTDYGRPSIASFRGAEHRTGIDGEVLSNLTSFSEAEQSSCFTVLLSAFFCLLSRYSSAEEIVIGTEISGRNQPALNNLLGPTSNQLVLRADTSGEFSFREMVRRVSEVWTEAQEHQKLPFATLLEALNVPRDFSRNPLYQVSFNDAPVPERIAVADTLWMPVALPTGAEALDLSVDVIRRSDDIQFRISYRTDLFAPGTVERMAGHFHTLLQSALEEPDAAVSRLRLLRPAEERQLVLEWNETRRDYHCYKSVTDLLEEQACKGGQRLAVATQTKCLTYAELHSKANRLARHLQALGVGPEVLVGISVSRSANLLIALLAVIKAGGAYVPLDPIFPEERLAYIASDAEIAVVVTEQELFAKCGSFATKQVVIDREWPALSRYSDAPLECQIGSHNLMYVLYTSGSTGKPKGVEIPHGAVLNFLQSMQEIFAITPDDRLLAVTTISFDIAGLEIYLPLAVGASVILAGTDTTMDGEALARKVNEEEITLMQATPATWQMLMEAGWKGKSDLKILCGGEALSPELAARLLPCCRELWNMYGPTETTIWSLVERITRPSSPILIGRPIANTTAFIVDKLGQVVPVGVMGELLIGGRGLARGYHARPELTAEKFIPDSFTAEPGARLYRSGDLARYREDGRIECLGRLDFQVKIRGFRIELGEIEALLAQRADIARAVVVVREDKPGDRRLVAYVVLHPGGSVDTAVVQNELRRALPDYMVPTAFVVMHELPLTPNKKVDRRALPAPMTDAMEDHARYAPPRNECERMLCAIWADALGLARVGIRDDFFELGGQSLMAARLISQIRAATGQQLPLAALFRASTVESLARVIEEGTEVERDPVVMEIQRGNGETLPFFAVVPPGEESLGYAMLARHMGTDQTVYKLQGYEPITNGKRPYSEQEMHDLTNQYVAAMRTVQPHGPYCLGGLCDGTHIGEQIVLKLEDEGEEVALFAIFDTWVMQHSQVPWLWRIDYYRQRLQQMKGLSPVERLASYRQIVKNKIETTVGAKAPRVDWKNTYWPDNFTPRSFRAPVLLFKRRKQPFFYVNDIKMGWGTRSQGGVEIHEIEFDHEQLLREPHVRTFGEILAQRIGALSAQAAGARAAAIPTSPINSSVKRAQQGS